MIWLNKFTNHTISTFSGLSTMLYLIVIDKMVGEMAFMICLICVILTALINVICSRRVEIQNMLYEFGYFNYKISNMKCSGPDTSIEF